MFNSTILDVAILVARIADRLGCARRSQTKMAWIEFNRAGGDGRIKFTGTGLAGC
jgi:hypothetical protein